MPVQSTKPRPNPGDAESRERSRLLTAVRMSFIVLILAVPILTVIQLRDSDIAEAEFFQDWWWAPIGVAVTLAIAFLSADLFIPRKKISTVSGIMLGLLAGLVGTVAISFVIELVAVSWDLTDKVPTFVFVIKILVGIALCYLGVTTVLQTQDSFRLVIPYVEFAKQMRGVRPLLLDTSALIDARIVEVAETGISQAPVIIPQFVVEELQRLADSSDKLKRGRGRRGLEVVARLQRSPLLDVSIDERPVASKAVDQMLVDLARQLPACIVTTDVGLTQVAAIHGVIVLNLNDLANALKPNVIPGEQLAVQLIRRGEQRTQAVGFLADGTMVVAEDGLDHIGGEVMVTVTSALQTSAGRMIFGRIGEVADAPEGAQPAPEAPEEPRDDDESQRADAPETAAPEARRGPHPPKPPSRANRARNPRR